MTSPQQGVSPEHSAKLHLKVLSEEGQVIDATTTGRPMVFTPGSGQLPPQVEAQLLGRQPGEHLSITISGDEDIPFADLENEAVDIADIKAKDPQVHVVPGLKLEVQLGEESRVAYVTQIIDDIAIVSFTHPFATLPLTFEVDIESVEPRA